MDKEDSQLLPADNGHDIDTKHPASGEPGTPPAAKKIKSFHDGLKEPGAEAPVLPQVVAIPEKVRCSFCLPKKRSDNLQASSLGRTKWRD